MLFSRPDLARFVNRYFEPVWETVRPVPLVRIDFGNGTTLTRTLHGNIATYACSADGQVLDIVPGIYTPAAYLARLDQLRLLANYVEQQGPDQREARLRTYHRAQAEALAKQEPPGVLINTAGLTKAAIERGVQAVLVFQRAAAPPGRPPEAARSAGPLPLEARADVASWKSLAEDTRANETVRRRQIHELLATMGLVGPAKVTKRIYKEVLHADLDDPYLGLGSVLFPSYPFQDGPAK